MPAKVLIPVDGARNSKTAEDYTVRLHEKMPLSVVLLSVIDTKDLDGHGLDPAYKESIIQAKRRFAEKATAEAASNLRAAGIECEKRLLVGHPANLICYTAQQEGFDMVIMAESGRTDFADWYLGSVTNNVLYHCRVPVLLVKHPRK
ncbi:MAG: universal stress protein [Thermodesulfobacteriota bacterium]